MPARRALASNDSGKKVRCGRIQLTGCKCVNCRFKLRRLKAVSQNCANAMTRFGGFWLKPGGVDRHHHRGHRNAMARRKLTSRSRTRPPSLPDRTTKPVSVRPVMMPTWCGQTTMTPTAGPSAREPKRAHSAARLNRVSATPSSRRKNQPHHCCGRGPAMAALVATQTRAAAMKRRTMVRFQAASCFFGAEPLA